jgi:uncharacterized membrane protein YeaQ/YmgE (transglycosylase-associated protein family)
MNNILWFFAGGLVGWIAFSYAGLSEGRGKVLSIILGAIGGVMGGKLIAPMFVSATAVPGEFSAVALLIAAAAASVFLVIGNMIHVRWGI